MAKKKIVEQEIADLSNGIEDNVPTPVSQSENEEATSSQPIESIPAPILRTLQIFSAYEKLWISPLGGVYVAKPTTDKGAILYKNPYYKS